MPRDVEKIRRLADRIEKCEEVDFHEHTEGMGPSFSMRYSNYAPCGAPACILGHNNDMHGRGANYCNLHVLAKDLGITKEQAGELCAPRHTHYAHYLRGLGHPGHITKEHAVAVLNNLADEGVVDWTIFGTGPSQGTP